MKISEFRVKIKNELQFGDKRVAYMYILDDKVKGGLCYTKEEALKECDKILNSEEYTDNSKFNIAIYNSDSIEVLGTSEVLLRLNKISMYEYLSASTIVM